MDSCLSEKKLPELIKKHTVNDVFFSYSDVSYNELMELALVAMAAGASFHLLGPDDTKISSKKPVIAVAASRSGAGKSAVSRKVIDIAKQMGVKYLIARHLMPYSDLSQAVQIFRTHADLEKYKATTEREEYEQHLDTGDTVLAGVDYQQILIAAERKRDHHLG